MLTINQCKEYLEQDLTDKEIESIRDSVYAFVGYALDKLPEVSMLVFDEDNQHD